MPRIRSTHPGQWRDEDFVECSFAARLLALALRNEADDQGIFEWKPKQIKMNCFPADSVDIDKLLSEIVAANIVKQYEVDGHKYGAIRNFRVYQRPKTPNSVHPLTSEIRKYVALEGRKSGKDTSSTNTISETDDAHDGEIPETSKQMEDVGGIKEEEISKTLSAGADGVVASTPKSTKREYPEDFEQFWSAYNPPKNAKKPDALKAWKATIGARPALDEMLRAVSGYRSWLAEESRKRKGEYPMQHPATFLRGEVWKSFLTPASEPVDSAETAAMWDGEAKPLVDEIGPAPFKAYFADAQFERGPPARIRVAKSFTRDLIERKFGRQIQKAYGETVLEVA